MKGNCEQINKQNTSELPLTHTRCSHVIDGEHGGLTGARINLSTSRGHTTPIELAKFHRQAAVALKWRWCEHENKHQSINYACGAANETFPPMTVHFPFISLSSSSLFL